MEELKIYAHRGYSAKYPENTLAAFRATAELAVEGVEFDVHLTADRKVVVIHDEKIDRTSNGSGYVKDMTFEELRQYDYGSWFSEEFVGEVIPTLIEVLEVHLKQLKCSLVSFEYLVFLSNYIKSPEAFHFLVVMNSQLPLNQGKSPLMTAQFVLLVIILVIIHMFLDG